MSGVTLLRAADRVAQPWRNGGGSTWTVAAAPADAGPDDFLWRVSIAQVTQAGPFSLFPDTDRHLTALAGRLALAIDGAAPVRLMPGESMAFAGDVPAYGEPIDGPVTDLNVMTRRGRATATIAPLADGRHTLAAGTSLFVAAGEATVEVGGERYVLDTTDAVRIDGTNTLRLTGKGWLIELRCLGTSVERQAPSHKAASSAHYRSYNSSRS